MKKAIAALLITFSLIILSCSNKNKHNSESSNDINHLFASINGDIRDFNAILLSQDMLYAIRTEESYEMHLDTLASVNLNYLDSILNTENAKKAFWLNTYNGLAQAKLFEDSNSYKNDLKAFFKLKNIEIGGIALSLDDIEHGIFRMQDRDDEEVDNFLNTFRLKELDYRIHFSLNCGGNSCPPIAFYEPEKIEKQLNTAIKIYLKQEAFYEKESNTVYAPEIMSWYEDDFGGKKGIISILKNHNIIPDKIKPKLKFKAFNWSLKMRKF